ncbi:hypothetical protein [Methylomagnum ishizawai]|uniref:hypothetical protein n=1 Tax=Methylomagnum ishizawai TaxID=1760988 RepID=UPI001C32A581|nr:hypothetical protein [Methylomagnum ishizawai]BBL73965.1 hypothetical protein MishRS11D_10630 [Methylomagnum ishizawai]
MSQAIFVNNCTTALASDVAQSATTLLVRAGEGAKFGTLGDNQHIWTRIGLPGGDQRVKVIGRTGDVLTLDPTTPTTRAWNAGTMIKVTVCAELLAELQQVAAGTAAIAEAIAAHEAEDDPHPVYLTQAEADGRYVQPDDISGFGTGDMLGSRNLNEVTDPAAARDNLGLGEVDNTADLDKPVSTATQAALDLKLDASAYNDRFKGLFATLAALESAYPTAAAGDYAQVDSGTGGALHVYSWDVSDGAWVLTSSDGTGAANTDQLPEGSTNLYFTVGRVLAAVAGLFATAAQGTKADNALQKDGSVAATGDWDVAGHQIKNAQLTSVRETAVTLSISGGAITPDLSLGNVFLVSLTTNITAVNAPTNVPASGSIPISIRFTQDATGGRTVAGWNSVYKFPGGTAPTITATANAVDWVSGTGIGGESRFDMAQSRKDSK